jgi:hypothetical protein
MALTEWHEDFLHFISIYFVYQHELQTTWEKKLKKTVKKVE